jgi:hypothetical protein
VVGHEDHPRGAVEAGLGEGVEQFADRGVGHRDRAVEIGEVGSDVGGVGQVVRHRDGLGRSGLVPLVRIRAVRLEETGSQQEGPLRAVGQPPLRAVHHVLAVGVRHIELVEPEPRRE